MPDENIPIALSHLPGVSILYNTVPPINISSGGSSLSGQEIL